MNPKEVWKRYSHVHVWWIIFILLSALIFLISMKTQNQSEIKDIINTSLALASLLLALVAIIQALLAGAEMSGLMASIRSSLGQIEVPADKILKASEVLAQHSATISSSTFELSKKLEGLNISSSTENKTGDDTEAADYITLGGYLALYICKCSIEQNKSFKVQEILDRPEMKIGTYIAGYATGYISSLKTTGSADIQAINEDFQVKHLGKLENLADRAKLELEGDLGQYKTRIDEYFESRYETM